MIWGLYTFAFSLLLIWTFEKFGSLKANILLHMSFNLMGMLMESVVTLEGAVLWAAGFAALAVLIASVVWMGKIGRKGSE